MSEAQRYQAQAVGIDRTDLSREFAELPAHVAYFGERYATALYDAECDATDLRRETARLYMMYRELLSAAHARGEGPKAARGVTEAMIDAAVVEDSGWVELKMRALSSECESVRLKGVCEALRAKKDMLVQLGAQERFDRGNQDPTMREREDRGEAARHDRWTPDRPNG